jgi:DNA-binding PadR family transcriptional regulator
VERRAELSVNEWAVLGVLVGKARHGYDIAAELQPGTPIGDAWTLTRQLVYRALERLEALGLAEPHHTEPSSAGPPRTIYGATSRGRTTLDTWLVAPVDHIRDIRNSFLLKLLIAEHLGRDNVELVRAQRRALAELLDRLTDPPPDDDVVALWRHHSAAAVAAFLEALEEPET